MIHCEKHHSMTSYLLLIISVSVVLLSGCALMLPDTADSIMSSIQPGPCPDLSGRYTLTGMVTKYVGSETKDQSQYDSFLDPNAWSVLEQLPYDHQENIVSKIYTYFMKQESDVEYDKRGMLKRKDFRDIKKIRGAYVGIAKQPDGQYQITVFSNKNEILGTYYSDIQKNYGHYLNPQPTIYNLCGENKYFHIVQSPANFIHDSLFAYGNQKKSTEIAYYLSTSGELVRRITFHTKVAAYGIAPITPPDEVITYTFKPADGYPRRQ